MFAARLFFSYNIDFTCDKLHKFCPKNTQTPKHAECGHVMYDVIVFY